MHISLERNEISFLRKQEDKTTITRTIVTYSGVKYGVYKKQNTLYVTVIDQNNKETMLDYINADLATYYFKLIEDKNLMKPISRTEMMAIISNISKQHPFFRD